MSANIPDSVWRKIWTFPEYKQGAHLVTLVLADGSTKRNLIVLSGGEIWRGDENAPLNFDPGKVVDAIHQAWSESDAKKPWSDPNNTEWWKG